MSAECSIGNIPPGYKQTEVGVIPEDWEVKPLGNIATIATGNTPPTRDPANYGDEFMFVSPVDLGFAKHVSHTEKMLSKRGFSISRPFPKGSVLFVCIGSTIGKCGIASETLTSNQQINAILPSEGMSYDYLYYSVSAVAPKVKSLAGEQAVPIVNKTQFSETAIPLPPTLVEQKAIAVALSDADAFIKSLEQLINKKRQIKQGSMQELLTGKRRLPGFSALSSYKETDIGVIPEDWEITSLVEKANVIDSLHQTPSFFDDGFSMVRVSDIKTGNLDLSRTFKVCETVFAEFTRNYKPKRGDIVLSRVGSYGVSSFVETDESFCMGQNTVVIEPKMPARLLYYVLNSSNIKQQIEDKSFGTGYKSLSLKSIKELKIAIPPIITEQITIATILSDMDSEITMLEEKLAKARQIKQGMMQELLTGKIRLI